MIRNSFALKYFFSGFFFLGFLLSSGQFDKNTVLQKIQSSQIEEDSFYDTGLFSTKRAWSFSKDSAEDNTIFFTASILSTFRTIYPLASSEEQSIIEEITAKAIPTFEKYKSRNGGITYNFWQTTPPDLPFPNGNKLIANPRLRLPDDYNTTILAVVAQGKNDSIDQLIRKKMQAYSARDDRGEVELHTLPEYEHSKAYEVWFGEKMPQTYDICVLSNVLFYVFSRNLELDQYDSASIDFIKSAIANDEHHTSTSYISHYNASPAVILYHVARMISNDKKDFFFGTKAKVIADLNNMLASPEGEMEKVLILSSLIRLDENPSAIPDKEKLENDLKSFVFFSVENLRLRPEKNPIYKLLPSVSWYCKAYNWTLFYEYLLLSEN